MTRQTRALLFASPVLLAAAATAQMIGPTVVFDPTAVGKIVKETVEVGRIYTTAMRTYIQLQMDARFLTSKNAFRGGFMQNMDSFFASAPVTDQWAQTALKGLGAANAYGMAAVTLKVNPAMAVPGSPFAPHYATAQIGIATGKQGLQTLGNTHQFVMQTKVPIQNCATAALKTDAAKNTAPSLLGVQTACNVLTLQQNDAALQVDSARLQMELLQAKVTSDNFTEYANMTTGFDQTVADTPMLPGNLAQTITSYPDR